MSNIHCVANQKAEDIIKSGGLELQKRHIRLGDSTCPPLRRSPASSFVVRPGPDCYLNPCFSLLARVRTANIMAIIMKTLWSILLHVEETAVACWLNAFLAITCLRSANSRMMERALFKTHNYLGLNDFRVYLSNSKADGYSVT